MAGTLREARACSMAERTDLGAEQDELTPEQMRQNLVRLAFGGDWERFREFCGIIEREMPRGTAAVLRGSAITGHRWKDGAAFDADGPGTSDLDLTLVGAGALQFYSVTGFYLPGVHSIPLSDEHPDIAPDLVPLRERLVAMVGRPVNIQGTRDFWQHLRGDLLGQPYLVLFGSVGER
jgi:hypothetical protein